MTLGGSYKGQNHAVGSYLEMKLGLFSSFTWEQLEDAYRAFQGKADRGEPLEDEQDISFADYVNLWLEYAKGRVEDQNYKNLKRDINNRLIPFFGLKGLKLITPADINLWQSRERETLSIASIKRNKNNLSSILNRALKDELIDKNPCTRSDRVRVPDSEPRYINPTEIRLLMNNAPQVNGWLQDYLLWCFHSGMRQGEIRKLKWSHVLIPDIGVPYLTFRTGKTGKIRRINCTQTMTDILLKLRPAEVTGDMKVFLYPKITIRRAWDKLREITGVHDVTLKAFRASNATYAVGSGVDLHTLGKRLGHSNLDMMQRHYAGNQQSVAIQAVEQMQNAFDAVTKAT
jgi:integrase